MPESHLASLMGSLPRKKQAAHTAHGAHFWLLCGALRVGGGTSLQAPASTLACNLRFVPPSPMLTSSLECTGEGKVRKLADHWQEPKPLYSENFQIIPELHKAPLIPCPPCHISSMTPRTPIRSRQPTCALPLLHPDFQIAFHPPFYPTHKIKPSFTLQGWEGVGCPLSQDWQTGMGRAVIRLIDVSDASHPGTVIRATHVCQPFGFLAGVCLREQKDHD